MLHVCVCEGERDRETINGPLLTDGEESVSGSGGETKSTHLYIRKTCRRWIQMKIKSRNRYLAQV